MSEINKNGSVPQQEEFGIGLDVKSTNRVDMPAGLQKAHLVSVKAEEIGKNTKYFTLAFSFLDIEGNKSFNHVEFIPVGKANDKQTEQENYESKRAGFNSRIKHIWEAFGTWVGIQGAKSWQDLFEKIASEFNNANEGTPIFMKNGKHLPVWIKTTYNNKNSLQFPLSPNFIEKGTEENKIAPKTLAINAKYDKITQTVAPDPLGGGNVLGGGASTSGGF